MPTIFSHALTATAAAQWWPGRLPPRFWTWTAVCAMLPDLDVIAFFFGIPYGDMFGHRGFTHSFFFAALVGAVAAAHVSHQPHPSHRLHPSHPMHLTLLFLWWDKRSPAVLGLDPKPRRLGELGLGFLGGALLVCVIALVMYFALPFPWQRNAGFVPGQAAWSLTVDTEA